MHLFLHSLVHANKIKVWHLEGLAKIMENTREAQEAVKADVDKLKEQLSQILEALKALQSNGKLWPHHISQEIR